MTHPDLEAMLSLRHATEVTDLKTVTELAGTADDDTADLIAGYISEQGRVLAWQTPEGDHVLREDTITVDDDYDWEPVGTPRIFHFDTEEEAEIRDDACRLFLSQSLSNGAARMSAGWRGRVVALVPEEVGAKESKIIRTLPDGGIEWTHTYNVLDAYSKYSEWVNALASEFGSTDDKLEAAIRTPDTTPFGFPVNSIVQSWLMREAADAALQQARHSLKFGLAAFSRLASTGTESGGSVAELARSLHTDRPNLTRAIKSAEADPELRELFAKFDRDAD
jgi:hypothetical protein